MSTKGFIISKPPLVVFLLSFVSITTYSQSKNAFDKSAITEEARTQLTQMSSAEGELSVFSSKNGIKGEFVIDMTIEGKGEVLTVFMVSANSDDISRKNLLKDKLHALQFENIRIPKKERIKFRHTLIF